MCSHILTKAMDKHSKETRRYNMSMIKSAGTKPEEMVRKYLFSRGLRYRKNVRSLPGKPDIVLRKYKTVVFVNGCFWHGHSNCKYFVMPKSNVEFWQEKISRTIMRDNEAYVKLADLGWNILTIWECQLKKNYREKSLEYLYYNIIRNIKD